MDTEFQNELKKVWADYLAFKKQSEVVRLATRVGTIVDVREAYYLLERRKSKVDSGILVLCSFLGWASNVIWVLPGRSEAEYMKWWIQKIYPSTQHIMLHAQKYWYFRFLRFHQEQAFPASVTQRTFSPYEQMLYDYHRFGVLPREKELSCAAD